jgi:hypothetical protein
VAEWHELEALLEEIKASHVARESGYGDRVCEACSSSDGKFEMAWPCDAARVSLMVDRFPRMLGVK